MISLIIPTYNNGQYILEAINSVLQQTYTNFECIIIDDGSTDNTKDLLQPYIDNKQIKYFYQLNAGVSSARNFGLLKCSGDYILFLDADDLLVKDALENLKSNIVENDIVFGTWADFGIGDNQTTPYNHLFENSLSNYIKYKPVISTALIKSSITKKWDESLKVWEVTDYFLTSILDGSKVIFINRVVTEIRQHLGINRATIIYDHFNPMLTLGFLKKWKAEINKRNMLNAEVELLLDENIINNIYTAINLGHQRHELLEHFKLVNFTLLRKSQYYQLFNLYGLVFLFRTYNTMKLHSYLSQKIK